MTAQKLAGGKSIVESRHPLDTRLSLHRGKEA
jgi:hypothetical protein